MGLDSLDVVDILMAFEDEFGKILNMQDPEANKISWSLAWSFVAPLQNPLHMLLARIKYVPTTSTVNLSSKASFNELGVEISDEQAEKIFTPKEAIEFMKTFLDIHDH